MVNELSARFFDLHLACVSPYRPAACLRPHFEAEYMTAPDHRLPAPFKRPLASTGASFTWRREMGRSVSALADDPVAFVPAVISAAPVTASAPSSPSAAGQMEIVFVGGERVIVDRTVDGVALARVIKVLSRR